MERQKVEIFLCFLPKSFFNEIEMKLADLGFLLLFISSVSCQSKVIQQACSSFQPYQLTASKGNIYSPGFEENKKYPPHSQCSYFIQVPYNRNLLLEIKHMDIETTANCDSDFVQISDPDKQLLIGKYCGSNITDRLIINSNVVFILFKSDIIVSGRGFHIAYEFTSKHSFCQDRELRCRNFNCVAPHQVCNLRDDCGDGSDEENCRQRRSQTSECGVPAIKPNLEPSGLRIVGGKEAIPGSWPWQADLQIVAIHPNGHTCGGSLINSQWVVSAAHCFIQFPAAGTWRIHLGNHHKFKKDGSEQIRYAKELFFYNPQFREDEQALMDDDIALIKLNAEVEFTSQVSPVCLPPPGFEIPTGTKCYSSGWGSSRGTGGNDVLKQAPVIVTDIKKCENPRVQIIPRTMVCTVQDGDNGGICHGDSGGPLVCNINNKWYLIGISSFGTDASIGGGLCAIDNIPTVYQKTSSKTSWIQSIIKRYG